MQETKERRAKVEQIVRDGLVDYYGDMRDSYDVKKRAFPHPYQVGDWVLSKVTNLQQGGSKALGPLYIGPAEIKEITATSAKIEFLNNGEVRLRSVNHLKPFYGSRVGEAQRLFTGPGDGETDLLDDPETAPVAGPSQQHLSVNSNDSDSEDEETVPRRVHFPPGV